MAINESVQNNNKELLTEQLNAFYSVYKAEIDEDILQAQFDGLDDEDW
jgi:hypothetical protein